MDTIILKMGNLCNLSCRYCSQEHLKKERVGVEISPALFSFLDEQKDKGVLIQFYGGEPLVYWSVIKHILERYQGSFSYMMVTNGTLLKKEYVDLFNKHNVRCLVSHDGMHTRRTKGKDILKSKRIVQLLHSLDNMEFISVISKENSRIDVLYDFYRHIGFGDTQVNLVFLVNHGSRGQRLLSNIDFAEFRKGVRGAVIRFELHRMGLSDYPAEYRFVHSFLSKMLEVKNESIKGYIPKCSTCGYFPGMDKVIVDLSGNIYDCQNQDNIIGNVADGIVSKDMDDLPPKELGCASCLHRPYCEGVCPNSTREGGELWCRFYRIIYDELLAFVKQKGEEMRGEV